MRMLETERLFLRPVEESDLAEILEFQWDKELMRYMLFKPLSMQNQKQWLSSLGGENLAFSIFYKHSDASELIGLATLNRINHLHQRASWGMKLKRNIQGKGVGYEASLIILHFAFSVLNMHKVHGDIMSENTANRKMCQKIGVREEGILIDHYFQNGKFNDVVLVGINKIEFNAINVKELSRLGLI